jgi:hypothetical protein
MIYVHFGEIIIGKLKIRDCCFLAYEVGPRPDSEPGASEYLQLLRYLDTFVISPSKCSRILHSYWDMQHLQQVRYEYVKIASELYYWEMQYLQQVRYVCVKIA